MRDGHYAIDIGVPADGTVCVQLGGTLDLGARDDLRDCLVHAAGIAGVTAVVVDLDRVVFVDSEALAGLIEGFLEVRATGVEIRATRPRGLVRRVLEVTGTTELFRTR